MNSKGIWKGFEKKGKEEKFLNETLCWLAAAAAIYIVWVHRLSSVAIYSSIT